MSRYAQQIAIPEFGVKGQKKLSDARVLIVGAGGLGTPLMVYLTAVGVGYITIIDGDRVTETNLHRQYCYFYEDLGKYKSQTLAEFSRTQNPSILINNSNEFLRDENAVEIINNHDIICDCTDNISARILINDICGQQKKPLIYASAGGWIGYVAVLHYKKNINLNDIFPIESLLEIDTNNCNNLGIMPTVCGVIASIQATELVKCILNDPLVSDGEIICFDGKKMEFKKFKLQASQ